MGGLKDPYITLNVLLDKYTFLCSFDTILVLQRNYPLCMKKFPDIFFIYIFVQVPRALQQHPVLLQEVRLKQQDTYLRLSKGTLRQSQCQDQGVNMSVND